MAVGFNTKSTKNYNKASNSIVMLAPPHGWELAQVAVRCERTEIQVKMGTI